MKSQEELLSEEVRAAADVGTRILQWGVTLMITLQTALFFVRQDVLKRYIDAGKVPMGSELPLPRYVMGTAFLVIVAFVLAKLTARSMEQYRNYKSQLIKCRTSGVVDLPIKHTGRWAYLLYFIFPMVDLLSRAYISIDLHFQ
jgi:hypothetical protein